MNDKLQRWWRSRTPEQKRYYKLFGVFGTTILVVAVSVILTKGNQPQTAAIARAKNSETYLKTNLKDMSGNGTKAQISKLDGEVNNLSRIIAAQDNISETQMRDEEKNLSAKVLANLHKHPIELIGEQQATQEENRKFALLEQNLAQTQSALQALEAERAAPEPMAAQAPFVSQNAPGIVISSGAGTGEGAAAPKSTAEPSASGITPPGAPAKMMRVSLPTKSEILKNKGIVKVSSKDSIYLPAGTILTGVTINGIDARTGPGARGAPEIVDIRVKKNAILPNRYRSNIENCEILASGYGSLESRRVYLRTNELSCVSRTGGVISAPIKGYIVGSDGIVGIQGTVISHQSSKLLKSFLAGLLSGIGGSGQTTSISPLDLNAQSGGLQGFQLPNPAAIGYDAAASGIGTAGGQLAKYYLDEAKALQPVIQVNPGVSATIILEYGTRVSLQGNTKRQIERTDYAVSQENNTESGGRPRNAAADAEQGNYDGMVRGQMPPMVPAQEAAGYAPGPRAAYPDQEQR